MAMLRPMPPAHDRAIPARRRRAGFTIFEVMMATMIMAFAIATSITALNEGFRALDTARNTTIAAQLMQSEMEDLRMLPWDASAPANSITSLETAQGPTGTVVPIDNSFTNGDPAAIAVVDRFTINRLITDVSGTSDLKNIELTATWKGIDGRSHTVEYNTYYAKDGLHDYFVR